VSHNSFNPLLAAALLASASFITATDAAYADAATDIRKAYLESYQDNPDISFLQALTEVFRQFDPSGEGLTEEKIAFAESVGQAQENAGFASHWLRFDLNADFKVEREEVEAQITNTRFARVGAGAAEAQKKRNRDRITKSVDQMFKGDTDGNGIIEGAELYNSPNPDREARSWAKRGLGFAKAILAADPNGDGVILESEATLVVAGALQGIEKDIAAAVVDKQERRQLGMGEKCPSINVAKDSRFVVFGAYGGSSLSTVSLAGQDEETHAATVFVEDGAKPMTLMVSSFRPMIWNFTGATHRLSKVILAGQGRRADNGSFGKPSIGAVGIDKEKVSVIETSQCFQSFYKSESAEAIKAKVIIEKLAQRPVDVMLGQYEPTIVAIPSGTGLRSENDGQDENAVAPLIAKAKAEYFMIGENGGLVPLNRDDANTGTQGELMRFNPFGLMSFKPETVVSEAMPEPYVVLPEHAGLLQLQGQGKIEFVSGNKEMWKVKSQIRYPAGLAGALSTSFFIPKGVPLPEGSPGHSCVFSEEKAGDISEGGLCR
jgi:hypothetical protein